MPNGAKLQDSEKGMVISMESIEETGKSAADIIKWIGTGIVSIYLFIMAVVFPFYFTDGYVRIGTDKSIFFRYVGIGFLLFIIPVLLVSITYQLDKHNTHKIFHGFDDTDILIGVFFVVTVISYFVSNNQEEAFWGAQGWYQGLVTQVIYLVSYFAISRFFRGEKFFVPLFAISSGIVFVLGILNRFSCYLWEMNGADNSFISTLGNINWFSGYWSIFFALGVGIFYASGKWRVRIPAGIYLLIVTAAGAIQGSDSALLVYFGVILVLYVFSCKDILGRKKFYETVMIICASCQGIRLARIIFPNAMNYESKSAEILTDGNLTLACFFIALFLWFAFHEMARRNLRIKKIMQIERGIILTGLGAGIAIFLYLLVQNSISPGSIGRLSENSVFTFNQDWGSKRGATWTAGMRVFTDQPFWRKLIGIGPDSFAYGVYAGTSSASAEVINVFGNARLTNAHNEWLTVLVNTGVLGMISFIGFQLGKSYKYLRAIPQNPMVFATGLVLVAYMLHNQVSFQQVLNGPFVYLFMGVGEALWIKNCTRN